MVEAWPRRQYQNPIIISGFIENVDQNGGPHVHISPQVETFSTVDGISQISVLFAVITAKE
jgi:hypothetical protein